MKGTEKLVKSLSTMICEDEARYKNTEEALNLLIKQSKIDGSVMADTVVQMWQKLKNTFTVDNLLKIIEGL